MAEYSARRRRSGGRGTIPPRTLNPGGTRPRGRLLRRILLIAGVAVLGLGVTAGAFLYTYAGDLPSLDNLSTHGLPQSSKIYDRTGTILLDERFADQRRTVVPLSQIAWDVRHATIAIEDRDFYNHGALNPMRVVAAAVYDLLHRSSAQGASTITQQLVKNYLLSTLGSARSIDRKIREALLAMQLEQKYSKDQILEMYLNTIFYGNQSYGIETAAETYFNSSAAALDPAEASFLAGLPQRPSYFDPFRPDGFKRAKLRQRDVLNAMVRDHYLTADAAHKWFLEDLQPKLKAAQNAAVARRSPIAPHFVDYVWDELEQRYDPTYLRQGGLKIITTLDVSTQLLATKSVQAGVQQFNRYRVNNGAMLVMNPHTGEILAMVGSADYFNTDIGGQVNYTVAARQPGSSFKPYTYATALMNGWTTASPLDDSNGAHAFPGYVVHDWDGHEQGIITLRQSLQRSRNISSVHLFKDVGIEKVFTVARQLGISTRLDPSLPTTLGASELRMVDHLSAYSAFANGGTRVRPMAVLEIKDSSGAVVESDQPKADAGERALPKAITYVLTDILKGAVSPRLNIPVAAKSGTTTDFKDAWYIGYSSDLAAAVWMGRTVTKPHPANESMTAPGGAGLWGEIGPGAVWHQFMTSYYASHKKPADWARPADVVSANFCKATGQLTDQTSPDLTIADIFAKTTQAAAGSQPCGQPAAVPDGTPAPLPGNDGTTPSPPVLPSIGPLPTPTPSPSPSG